MAPSLAPAPMRATLVVDLNRPQGVDAGEADHAGRLGDVFLLHVVQIGAAGEQFGVAPAVLQEGDGLLGRGGTKVGEVFHGLGVLS